MCVEALENEIKGVTGSTESKGSKEKSYDGNGGHARVDVCAKSVKLEFICVLLRTVFPPIVSCCWLLSGIARVLTFTPHVNS